MLDAGYHAELETDSYGDPIVRSADSGIRFAIRFYGKGPRYSSIQLCTGFTVEHESLTLERAQEWNRRRRFGRLFADDDGDLILEMDLDVEDGFTVAAFNNSLVRWTSLMGAFWKFIYE